MINRTPPPHFLSNGINGVFIPYSSSSLGISGSRPYFLRNVGDQRMRLCIVMVVSMLPTITGAQCGFLRFLRYDPVRNVKAPVLHALKEKNRIRTNHDLVQQMTQLPNFLTLMHLVVFSSEFLDSSCLSSSALWSLSSCSEMTPCSSSVPSP